MASSVRDSYVRGASVEAHSVGGYSVGELRGRCLAAPHCLDAEFGASLGEA